MKTEEKMVYFIAGGITFLIAQIVLTSIWGIIINSCKTACMGG